ncbi:hypothetical protein F7O87_24740, partial [Pseudomonas aeruginosa]
QLVEYDLAKVGVASSSLVSRSKHDPGFGLGRREKGLRALFRFCDPHRPGAFPDSPHVPLGRPLSRRICSLDRRDEKGHSWSGLLWWSDGGDQGSALSTVSRLVRLSATPSWPIFSVAPPAALVSRL